MRRNCYQHYQHYEKSHVHICETCYEWEETRYRGDAEIAKHNYLVHETQDKTLTDQEFEDLSNNYQRQIINGPDTPKMKICYKEWKKERKRRKKRIRRKVNRRGWRNKEGRKKKRVT